MSYFGVTRAPRLAWHFKTPSKTHHAFHKLISRASLNVNITTAIPATFTPRHHNTTGREVQAGYRWRLTEQSIPSGIRSVATTAFGFRRLSFNQVGNAIKRLRRSFQA